MVTASEVKSEGAESEVGLKAFSPIPACLTLTSSQPLLRSHLLSEATSSHSTPDPTFPALLFSHSTSTQQHNLMIQYVDSLQFIYPTRLRSTRVRYLFCPLVHLKYLELCLAHSKYLIICWVTWMTGSAKWVKIKTSERKVWGSWGWHQSTFLTKAGLSPGPRCPLEGSIWWSRLSQGPMTQA